MLLPGGRGSCRANATLSRSLALPNEDSAGRFKSAARLRADGHDCQRKASISRGQALGVFQAPWATVFLHQPFGRFCIADDGFRFWIPVNLLVRSHGDIAKMAYCGGAMANADIGSRSLARFHAIQEVVHVADIGLGTNHLWKLHVFEQFWRVRENASTVDE